MTTTFTIQVTDMTNGRVITVKKRAKDEKRAKELASRHARMKELGFMGVIVLKVVA